MFADACILPIAEPAREIAEILFEHVFLGLFGEMPPPAADGALADKGHLDALLHAGRRAGLCAVEAVTGRDGLRRLPRQPLAGQRFDDAGQLARGVLPPRLIACLHRARAAQPIWLRIVAR